MMQIRVKGQPVINVDHDGPLYAFTTAFHRFAQLYTGRALPLVKIWDFWKQEGWEMTHAEWLKIFEAGILHGAIWGAGDVVPGAAEGMRALSNEGYHIRIVSSKLSFFGLHAKVISAVGDWLDDNVIPFRSIAFLADGEAKSNYLANILIDDSSDNVKEWANSTDDWDRAVLFDCPYNQNQATVGLNSVSGIYRARDWNDVLTIVRKKVPNG